MNFVAFDTDIPVDKIERVAETFRKHPIPDVLITGYRNDAFFRIMCPVMSPHVKNMCIDGMEVQPLPIAEMSHLRTLWLHNVTFTEPCVFPRVRMVEWLCSAPPSKGFVQMFHCLRRLHIVMKNLDATAVQEYAEKCQLAVPRSVTTEFQLVYDEFTDIPEDLPLCVIPYVTRFKGPVETSADLSKFHALQMVDLSLEFPPPPRVEYWESAQSMEELKKVLPLLPHLRVLIHWSFDPYETYADFKKNAQEIVEFASVHNPHLVFIEWKGGNEDDWGLQWAGWTQTLSPGYQKMYHEAGFTFYEVGFTFWAREVQRATRFYVGLTMLGEGEWCEWLHA